MEKKTVGNQPNQKSGKTDPKEISNNGTSFEDFKLSWKQFDKAGSRLLVQLCESLAGSQYNIITKEIVALLGPVFACGESELVLGRMKELEKLMAKNDDETSQDNLSDSKQKSLRCLLLYIKLNSEYHQLCMNLVTSAIDHLNVTCDDQEHSDLLQEIQALKLQNISASVPSPVRHAGLRRTSSGTGSNSPKTQKHGLKASLFSLFERKNSPDEGKSSFYVDIDQNNTEGNSQTTPSQSESVSKGHVTGNSQLYNAKSVNQSENEAKFHERHINQSDDLIDFGLDPNPSERNPKLSPSRKVPTPNGQVATQEELDSVINLLSGYSLGRGSMQTIPEVKSPYSLLVPQGPLSSALSPSTSDSLDERDKGSPLRNKAQRRSEGSIDLSGFTKPGHNTWPHQHRASLPGGQLGGPPQITYDFASTPIQPPYGAGFRPNTLPPGGAGHFQTSYGMGFPDPKLNRTWPVSNLAGTGSVMDARNSTWSGGQDSDDLSDDSSGGEPFHSMSRLQYSQPRRDLFVDSETSYLSGDVKHHSLEDLLDGRSNTWPQQLQQPWSQSHLGAELLGSHDQGAYHRPISMQMSDPLSRRNIWQNSGPELQMAPPQSQSVHGGLGHM